MATDALEPADAESGSDVTAAGGDAVSATGDGTPIDIHTTAGKIADLENRRYEAIHAGSERAVERQHAKGKMTARERIDHLLDPGSFTEFDELARHRAHDFGIAADQALRRRRGDRLRHHRRAAGVRVQPGLHGLRRLARRGLRREDRQGHGPRAEGRLPGHRHQRQRRRQDPGRRGRARPVRRDLLPQRDGLRRHPADLTDPGSVRGRRGLLPRDHRLHADGRPDLAHVHHRARTSSRPSPARRSASRTSAAPTRTTPSPGSRTTRPPTSRTAWTSPAICCPTCRPTTSRSRRSCPPASAPRRSAS